MSNQIMETAIRIFGSQTEAEYWLCNKHISSFGGLSPSEVILQGGCQEVLDILHKIEEELDEQ